MIVVVVVDGCEKISSCDTANSGVRADKAI